MDLAEIQKRAAALSKTRDVLAGLLRTLQEEIDVVKRGSIAEIRGAARRIAAQHNELQQLIRDNPALFTKPRTHIVDGLKFGLVKRPGTLSWGDDDKLCERIHKQAAAGELTAEQVGMLITTAERPVAKALEQLDGKLLKKLGVTLGEDSDEPVIKSVDSEVEKAVNAVIKDATKDANAEVATS